ncbi:unnamed protein product [Brugia pahangi]|uniref:Very-long-chain (3R)-3-hydroxyacyl-CoA dehydratase n=1 Tax=Brugia pahangi TaxID=6280 RepID=A0A0N4TM62_BRUPA|nr:unnamed protein product [Brugia pahangi]
MSVMIVRNCRKEVLTGHLLQVYLLLSYCMQLGALGGVVIRVANDVMLSTVQLYLFSYNALQSCGWSVILWYTLRGLLRNESYEQLYQACELELQIFQSAAILEIVHAAACFVRSPVGTTTMQVFSRVSLVFILYKVVSAQASIGVLFLLTAWSVTEVIRYSYYGLALINAVSDIHTWLRQSCTEKFVTLFNVFRYSLFIILYPLGVCGELLVILAALPEIATKKHLTVELPNICNIGFSFWWYLIAYIILYIPGLGFRKCTSICLSSEKKFFQWKPTKSTVNFTVNFCDFLYVNRRMEYDIFISSSGFILVVTSAFSLLLLNYHCA